MNNRLSPDEMAKVLETARTQVADLENDIKTFSTKLQEFDKAWSSSTAEKVRSNIESIKANLEKAKNSLTSVYNKIDKTTTNVELSDNSAM